MVKEDKDFIMIDFTGIIKRVIQKLWLIVLIGVISAGVAGVYAIYANNNQVAIPMYTSTVKLYVTGNYTAYPSTNAKTLGQSYIEDFYLLMKSRKVISQVISDLQLNMTNNELISCISKSTVTGTCMTYLSVTFPDAELSKAIVDDLLAVSSAYALEIMGMTPPKVYEEAIVPIGSYSYSSISITNYAIYGFAGGAVVALLVILVLYFADNKFRTPKQIEERMKLPVLTVTNKSINPKKKQYNNNAMQNLYGDICALKKNNEVITFFNAEHEDKLNFMKMFAEFLQEISKSVVIVDANLMYPAGNAGNGLQKCLESGVEDIESVVHEVDGIDVLDNENQVPNAVELLGGAAFEQLIGVLKEKYDYILINAPATEFTSEAKVMLDYSDVNVVVVECGKSKIETCTKLASQFNTMTGVVLTNVKLATASSDFRKTYGKYMGII